MSDPGSSTAADPSTDPSSTDDTDSSPTVLLTVTKDADGTYTLIQGDEEDDDTDDAAPAASPASGATPPAPAGQTFDDIGPLMKAIMQTLKDDQDNDGGGADANFDAGFNGSPAPTPKG